MVGGTGRWIYESWRQSGLQSEFKDRLQRHKETLSEKTNKNQNQTKKRKTQNKTTITTKNN